MADSVEYALARGRGDPQYWSWYFLEQRLHDGQAEWIMNAEASTNVLATGNRWGKSFVCCVRHFHRCFYKLGAEWRYIDPIGEEVDTVAYRETKYHTLHCAQGWDTVQLVWDHAYTLCDRPRLRPFIKARPRSGLINIQFVNGSKWVFRTLGENGQGVDGTSLYLVSIDEAGWMENLKWILDNVVRVRVADVQGMVDLVGTMKPGISRDFFKEASLAAVYTGKEIFFDFEAWAKAREEGDAGARVLRETPAGPDGLNSGRPVPAEPA